MRGRGGGRARLIIIYKNCLGESVVWMKRRVELWGEML